MASSYTAAIRWRLGGLQNSSRLPRACGRLATSIGALSSLRIPQAIAARGLAMPRVHPTPTSDDPLQQPTETIATIASESVPEEKSKVRMPRAVQAAYMRPLKRQQTHGLPVCDLQLRSYSVRNVEFMADFALRAAYYLNMPASGPIPLPKIIKRWTVPKSNFIFKKTQENFERITLRRLIQIKDAHPETVQIWLAFIRKHAFHGVGMKANVWHHEKLIVGSSMDANSKDLEAAMAQAWSLFGRSDTADKSEKVTDAMQTDRIGTALEGTELKSFQNS